MRIFGGYPAGLEQPLGMRSLEGTELSPAVLIFQQHEACKEKLWGFRKNATVCYLLWGISTCPSAQLRALLRERALLPGAPPALSLELGLSILAGNEVYFFPPCSLSQPSQDSGFRGIPWSSLS